ncbi:MAG: hypothetical protein A2V93_09355 [Ignavibacteria bacterium RBG_16_34_14]|nr:MAG: hypothetical protein A2V93_09355 [Ignavibacteria bacterium RBG_16_34_14]
MRKLFKYIISKEIILSLFFLLLTLVIYSILRFGFLIANYFYFDSLNSSDIALSFIKGIRFDLAAIVMINLPVMLLLNLPLDLRKKKWFRLTIFFLFFVINLTAITLNIADYGYFPTIERRLLWEPYTMLPDIIRMIPGLISNHYVLFISFIIACCGFFLLTRFFYLKIYGKLNLSFNYSSGIISFLLVICFSIIAIRGGLQMKPLRLANAFTYGEIGPGYLTLNTTYTVAMSYFQEQLPEYKFLSDKEANEIVQKMIKADDEIMLDISYPFLRRKSPNGQMKKMNVVIFIMEGWSALFNGSITGEKTFTPFFDSLASNGLLFTNYFASGQRSIEGIPAILASLPAVYSSSIIGSIEETNKIRGLGSILSEQGYITSFHHGGTTGTMGFDTFTKIAGFMKYFGKESYPDLSDDLMNDSWGIHDEPFFLETEKVLSSFQEPFCAAIFSVSSHDPFKVPKNRISLFESYKDESDKEKTYRYSDFSLRQFFKKASSEPWFKNTLFIITADHTLYTARTGFYTSFHTPLLIYSPSLVAPRKTNKVASHIDILPTILDILKIPTIHSAMGFSVLDSTKKRYAYVKYGPSFGIISDDYVLFDDLEHSPRIYNYHLDPMLKNDLSAELKEVKEDLNKKLYAYLQQVTHSIGENKVYK